MVRAVWVLFVFCFSSVCFGDADTHLKQADEFFFRKRPFYQILSNSKPDDYRAAIAEYRIFLETYRSPTFDDVRDKDILHAKLQIAESYFLINHESNKDSESISEALREFESLRKELISFDLIHESLPRVEARIVEIQESKIAVHLEVGEFYFRRSQDPGYVNTERHYLTQAIARYRTALEEIHQLFSGITKVEERALIDLAKACFQARYRFCAMHAVSELKSKYPDHAEKRKIDDIREKLELSYVEEGSRRVPWLDDLDSGNKNL